MDVVEKYTKKFKIQKKKKNTFYYLNKQIKIKKNDLKVFFYKKKKKKDYKIKYIKKKRNYNYKNIIKVTKKKN